MVTQVDAALPVHALTVADVDAMVEAGILEENSRIELLDGVLVEMSPQGPPHAYALRHLMMLGLPIAASADLEVSMDLGPKARIYATAGVPEYWVLDVQRREIVVHRAPSGSSWEHVERVGVGDTLTATTVALTVPVADLF